eukprot:scaffold13490_cov69-Attheya_sp.AAC.6
MEREVNDDDQSGTMMMNGGTPTHALSHVTGHEISSESVPLLSGALTTTPGPADRTDILTPVSQDELSAACTDPSIYP